MSVKVQKRFAEDDQQVESVKEDKMLENTPALREKPMLAKQNSND